MFVNLFPCRFTIKPGDFDCRSPQATNPKKGKALAKSGEAEDSNPSLVMSVRQKL